MFGCYRAYSMPTQLHFAILGATEYNVNMLMNYQFKVILTSPSPMDSFVSIYCSCGHCTDAKLWRQFQRYISRWISQWASMGSLSKSFVLQLSPMNRKLRHHAASRFALLTSMPKATLAITSPVLTNLGFCLSSGESLQFQSLVPLSVSGVTFSSPLLSPKCPFSIA